MKFRYLYIAVLAFGVLLQGCARVEPDGPDKPEIPETPEKPSQDTDDPIGVYTSVVEASTKGFIDNTNNKTDGNQYKVYDFLTFPSTGEKVTYIDGDVITYSTDRWTFPNSKVYPWTRTGNHRFLGWLQTDNTVNPAVGTDTFWGSAPSLSNENTLVLSRVMNASAPQYDFLYSNVIKREMYNRSDDNHTKVNLQMSHLFASIGVGAVNSHKEDDITITSVKLTGIQSTKTATITFPEGNAAGASSSVAYTNPAPATCKFTSNREITLVHNADGTRVNDILTGSNSRAYYMIWPQTSQELKTSVYTVDEETGMVTAYDEDVDPLIIVKYKVNDVPDELTAVFPLATAHDVALSSIDPGYKYHIDVVFADKLINLKISVLPWNYESTDIDFTTGTVSGNPEDVLKFNSTISTVSDANHTVTLRQEQPAVGTFRLQTPLGASVVLSLDGDWDYFSTEVTEGGVVDGNHWTSFKVTPLVTGPKRNYTVTVNIKLRLANGTMVDADSVLQPTKYTIILPAA